MEEPAKVLLGPCNFLFPVITRLPLFLGWGRSAAVPAQGCAADTSHLQGPGDMNSLSGEASGLLQSYCIRPLHPYMGRRDAEPRGVKGGREARESLWGEETLYGFKNKVSMVEDVGGMG